MTQQVKLVLRDTSGSVEHAQGMIAARIAATATLVKRNEHLYRYQNMKIEQGVTVLFYNECEMLPYIITEW